MIMRQGCDRQTRRRKDSYGKYPSKLKEIQAIFEAFIITFAL